MLRCGAKQQLGEEGNRTLNLAKCAVGAHMCVHVYTCTYHLIDDFHCILMCYGQNDQHAAGGDALCEGLCDKHAHDMYYKLTPSRI